MNNIQVLDIEGAEKSLLFKKQTLFKTFQMVCVGFLILFSLMNMNAQGDLDDDEPWDLENLDRGELDSIQTEQQLDYYNSHGWFPSTWGLTAWLGLDFQGTSVWEYGKNIRLENMVDVGLGYDAKRRLANDEQREMFEPLPSTESLNTEDYEGYKIGETGPVSEVFRIGIKGMISTGLPLWIELSAGYFCVTNVASARVSDRPYRARAGDIRYYDEGYYLVAEQEGIYFGAMAKIPLYGAFVGENGYHFYNTYNLLVGFEREVGIKQTYYQYNQIETGKNSIRYSNRLDTVRLSTPGGREDFEPYMDFIPIGVSWEVGARKAISLSFALTYDIGISDMFKGQGWRNDRFTTRAALLYGF